jgi:uncharacterized phage protein (TIGR02220 family)
MTGTNFISERQRRIWTEFMLRAFEAYSKNEPVGDFCARMEKAGFVLEFVKPSRADGISDKEFFISVMGHLNFKASTSFRTKFPCSNAKLIMDRRKEGYSIEDFHTVIDNKCAQWLGTNYEVSLTPRTLFSKEHFDNYLNQKMHQKASSIQNASYGDTTAAPYVKLTAADKVDTIKYCINEVYRDLQSNTLVISLLPDVHNYLFRIKGLIPPPPGPETEKFVREKLARLKRSGYANGVSNTLKERMRGRNISEDEETRRIIFFGMEYAVASYFKEKGLEAALLDIKEEEFNGQ